MTALVCRVTAILVALAGVAAIAFAARIEGSGVVAAGIFVVVFGIVVALWALGRIARDVSRLERHLRPARKGRAAEPLDVPEVSDEDPVLAYFSR